MLYNLVEAKLKIKGFICVLSFGSPIESTKVVDYFVHYANCYF